MSDDWIAIPRDLFQAIVMSEATLNVRVKAAGDTEYVTAHEWLELIAFVDRANRAVRNLGESA